MIDRNELYDAYKSNKRDEFVLLALELVRLIINGEFHSIDEKDKEDLASDSIVDILKFLSKNRKNRFSDSHSLFKFLYSVIRNRCLMSLKYKFHDVYNFWEAGVSYIDYVGKVPSIFDIERKIYLKDLKNEVKNGVLKTVRFNSKCFQACEYLVNCLLEGEQYSEYVLKEKFGIKDTVFLVDYVKVLIRKKLWSISNRVLKESSDLYMEYEQYFDNIQNEQEVD